MTALDKPLRAVTKQLVRTLGQSVTFIAPPTVSFDPATDTVAQSGNTETTLKAVVTAFTTDELDNTIRRGDRKVMVAAQELTTVPTPDWKVSIGSRIHDIVAVETLVSGEQDAAYIIAARGQ
jgi:hypothetical protein